MYRFLEEKKFIPFAHRGANYLATENTHEAFEKAVELGFSYIETDVRASKDGEAFIFHDHNLSRMTGDKRSIEDLTSRDLATIRLRGTHVIPKLTEIFESFPEIYFNIDAKSWAVVGPLARIINNFKNFEMLCLSSFNDWRLLKLLKKLKCRVCFSAGTLDSIQAIIFLKIGLRHKIKAPCLQVPLFYNRIRLIDQSLVQKTKKMGLKLHVWGTNDSNLIAELIDCGVDGLMVDDCVMLKKILTKKKLWG